MRMPVHTIEPASDQDANRYASAVMSPREVLLFVAMTQQKGCTMSNAHPFDMLLMVGATSYY